MMLKKIVLITTFILLALGTFSQIKKQGVNCLFTSQNRLIMPEDLDGDMGYSGRGLNLYELRYSRQINGFFSIETGLEYSFNKIEKDYFPTGIMYHEESNIKMLSIPIYGNLTF